MIIKIGYKEIGQFNFDIDSEKSLIGEVLRLTISTFNVSTFIKLDRLNAKMKHGGVSARLVNSNKIAVEFEFENNLDAGAYNVEIAVNGKELQKINLQSIKLEGDVRYNIVDRSIQFAFPKKILKVSINGERVKIKNNGKVSYTNYMPIMEKADILYTTSKGTFYKIITPKEHKVYYPTLVKGNSYITSNHIERLAAGYNYRFIHDGELFKLRSANDKPTSILKVGENVAFNEGVTHMIYRKDGFDNKIIVTAI